MAEKKSTPDPFQQRTSHVATRELEGHVITVGDIRAMFLGTRLPNNARVTFEEHEKGTTIRAEWETR